MFCMAWLESEIFLIGENLFDYAYIKNGYMRIDSVYFDNLYEEFRYWFI